MWRRAFRTTSVLLAGVVAGTVVVELGFRIVLATPLRWALPLPSVALYGPDPATGARHRAGVSGMWLTEHRTFVKISNLGLRDRDRELAHGDAPRAVVIGDSFIEALQVEQRDTAVAVAERILARDIPGAEVVNLGLAGARPAVEVARLQSDGLSLTPNVAVIVLLVDQLLAPDRSDDHEFTAYRRGDDGEFHPSYGFRASRGYRFRTSTGGRIFYGFLDHLQVMRAINDRKNAGLLAEWSPEPPMRAQSGGFDCSPAVLDRQAALWIDGEPADARALLDAFIRDLAAIGRSKQLPIVIATRGIEARCPLLEAKRTVLIGAMRIAFERAGLHYLDLDQRIVAQVGVGGVAPLYGFGAQLGLGHLNVEGNRVYGEILAETIGAVLQQHSTRR